MSWYSFRPYVSVAERRRKAEAAAKKLVKKSGRPLAPVNLASRKIATTFWGKAWCDNLEAYSDFANRLPRGRTYVRNGSVIDLQILRGKVEALVQGSDLYKIAIGFSPLAAKRWKDFKSRSAGKVINLLDLLQGRLSKDILADITAKDAGLFPSPKEIDLDCSCPDWADMCKHVAAVLYGVGARLDEKPELFFTLRGVDMQELVTAASTTATTPIASAPAADTALAGADLTEIFGVEIESGATPAPIIETKARSPRLARPTRQRRELARRKSSKAKVGKAARKPRTGKATKPIATKSR
ncbi:MAG: SWIM zinc finger family protein [Verrucomicrobia bacterium]|nr:SWIM zinc finger family protein [Verrucomicrobiota bacterium]